MDVCVAGYAPMDAAVVMETVVAMEERRDILRKVNLQFQIFLVGILLWSLKIAFFFRGLTKGAAQAQAQAPRGLRAPSAHNQNTAAAFFIFHFLK